MRRLLLTAALLLPGFQDPDPRTQDLDSFNFVVTDPESKEIRAEFSGFREKVSGDLQRVHVTVYTRPSKTQEAHTIHLFSDRCVAEGVGHGESRGKGVFRFSGGLRGFVDDEVRLITTEGMFDMQTQTLHCPKATRLVQYRWPPKLDLASALVFMDPTEMDWLEAFGAPAPVFELAGEDFTFDASANTFIAGRKGRIRVAGNPELSSAPERKKPKAAKPISPTELRCEGPLRLQDLGAPDPDTWKTLHITAERDVVIENRSKDGLARAHGDSASIYLGVPQKSNAKTKPRMLSAVLKGGVRLEESRGFSATADRLEWNYQDALLRLAGAPHVEVSEGRQRLQARSVLVDRSTGTVDFKGDIEASFLPRGIAPAPGAEPGVMTLKPGDLRMHLDPSGRPVSIHARNGVTITSRRGAAGRQAIDGTAAEFEWDLVSGEGLLRGAPYVRILQGSNFVLAPLVTFRGESIESSFMVIKGPKLLRFLTEKRAPVNPGARLLDAALGLGALRKKPDLREPTLNASATFLEAALGLPALQRIPGRRESVLDLAATSEGDVVIDWTANLVKLVDRCSVRTQDATLIADRLFVLLAEGGESFDRVIGLGHVRASQNQGPRGSQIRIEGETLELRQDPSLGSNGELTVTVVGHPEGRGVLGTDEILFERMTYNLDTRQYSIDAGRFRPKF